MPPPPSSEKPSRIDSDLNVTLPALGWISNSRSMPRASTGALGSGKPPSMNVAPAPVPTMFTVSTMSWSPVLWVSSLTTGISSS